MKLLVAIAFFLTCGIAASEAYGYRKYGQYYGLNKYYGLRYGKIGGGYGVGYKFGNKLRVYYDNEDQDPTFYYPGKNVVYPYSIYGRGYGLNKYKYGQYGLRNGLGHRNYGRNYLRHGYKNSYNRRLYYDEENQDASPYYPKNHGNFQYGKYSYRFGNYRYGKYGRGYGFGRYGGKNGLRYGRFGKKYVGHGYRKGHIGKPYYDEEEQDPSRYYPVKPGPHQRGKYRKGYGLSKFQYRQYSGKYGIGKYGLGKNSGRLQYGRRFGNYKFGAYGGKNGFGRYGGIHGLRSGIFGKRYLGYGYRKGYKGRVYKDEENHDSWTYPPRKTEILNAHM